MKHFLHEAVLFLYLKMNVLFQGETIWQERDDRVFIFIHNLKKKEMTHVLLESRSYFIIELHI